MRIFKNAFIRMACVPVFICLAGFIGIYGRAIPYFYCLARESSWLQAKTEAELDRKMFMFYSKRPIAPSESMWGRRYDLKPGERMIQYLVFYCEPYDVVFDSESRIIEAFTSYE